VLQRNYKEKEGITSGAKETKLSGLKTQMKRND